MSGDLWFTSSLTGVKCRSLYFLNSGDVIDPKVTSDVLDEIYRQYGHVDLSLYSQMSPVEVWNMGRSDVPPDLKPNAGITWYWGLIQLNGYYHPKTILGHEFGHWLAFWSKIQGYQDAAGKKMWDLYCKLRGQDFTSRTSGSERFAEDFKALFGNDFLRGKLDPNDDYYVTGGKVRSTFNVPGLRDFIYLFPFVLDRWRNYPGILNERYDNGVWYWQRPVFWWSQDEKYEGGKFYYKTWWGNWALL